MNLLDHPADCDVHKIRAKIRDTRFRVNTLPTWIKWGALLGLLLGVLRGTRLWWPHPFHARSHWFALDPVGECLVWALAGVALGCVLSVVAYGLAQFLRPIHVALFRDVAQFEREYGSTTERVQQSL